MPDILELHRLRVARRHRPGRMKPLQRLNTGFFINADDMHPRLMQLLRLMIALANRTNLRAERGLVIDFMVQPVPDTVWLEFRLILKTRKVNLA